MTQRNSKLGRLYSYLAGRDGANRASKGSGRPITHTSINPSGSYSLSDDQLPKLYSLLADALTVGEIPHIIEMHKGVGPVVVDLDFKYPDGVSTRQYTMEHIEAVAKLYADAIEDLFDVDDSHLMVHVYQKEGPDYKGNGFADGLHMVFPYVRTIPDHQYLLRSVVMGEMEKRGTLSDLVTENGLEDIVDRAVIKNAGWMLYGCSKNIHSRPYHLTHTFAYRDGNWGDILDGCNTKSKSFLNLIITQTSIRSDINCPVTNLRRADDIPGDIVSLKERKKLQKECMRDYNTKGKLQNVLNEKAPLSIQEEVTLLLSLISKERAVGYGDWIQVGLALKSIDRGLAKYWLEFSQQCPEKYDEGVCLKKWAKFEPRTNRMATLHWMARKDSPDKYSQVQQTTLENMNLPNYNINHDAISTVLHEKFRFRFKCSNIKNKIWYEYLDHRWQPMDCADGLYNSIASDIVPYFVQVRRDLIIKSADKTGFEKQAMDKQADSLQKKIDQLGDGGFKNGVINNSAFMFKDKHFDDVRDEDHMLLGCTNGVFDFRTCQFRDGYPDDNITMCTNVEYVPYDPDNKYVIQVLDFINTIQTEEINAHYILTLLSSCLIGSVADESLYILTGIGSNGKSKLMELVRKTLGDYCKTLDVLLLTGRKTNSSNASPELADKKGVRMCVMDEPEKGAKINQGLMKNLTGGDELTARALYSNQIYYKPQFKLFMVCNTIPEMDDSGTDFSIWRRLKAILFDSVFYKKSEMKQKNIKNLGPKEFTADTKLSKRMEKWPRAFLSILIDYHINVFCRYGLQHPDSVIKHTLEFQKECDKYSQFIGDCLTKTNEKEDTISVMTLLSLFRDWNNGVNGKSKAPTKKEMVTYLNTNLRNNYDDKKGVIWGYTRAAEDLDDI